MRKGRDLCHHPLHLAADTLPGAPEEPPLLPALSCQHLRDYLRTQEGAESLTGNTLEDPCGGGAVKNCSLGSGSVRTHSQPTGCATLICFDNRKTGRSEPPFFFSPNSSHTSEPDEIASYRRKSQSQPFSEPPLSLYYPGLSLWYKS